MRDVTLREDASRIRKGSALEVLAWIRNGVLKLLGRLSQPRKAAAIRHLAMHLEEALELLSTSIR